MTSVSTHGCNNAEFDNKLIHQSFSVHWLPYSREQKHVSISDTPMLLIEINSISDMGCQKKTFLFVVPEWAEIKIL